MDRLAAGRLTELVTSSPYLIATTATAVTGAVVAGVFYAFSTFVMTGLDRAQPGEAVAAMRGINAEAQANAPFLLLFVGSAVLALGVGITAATRLSQHGSGYVLVGAALILVAFVVTVTFNVPLNDHLAGVDPLAGDVTSEWQAYLRPWTAWNHVRTIAPLLGSVLMLVGLRGR